MQFFYALPIHCVFIEFLFIIIVWNFIYIGTKTKFSKLFLYLNRVLLIIYFFIIIYITLLSRKAYIQEIDLIPFHSFIKAQLQPEIYRSMFMNFILFSPIGIFMSFCFKRRSDKNIYITLIFAILFSILIETLQYILKLGYCEIDDVIINSLGALWGSLSYRISRFIELRKNHG